MRRGVALSVASVVWLVGIPLAHAAIPWAISLLGPRHGWTAGRPAIWNLLGLILIGAGGACLAWIMRLHFARTPESVDWEWTPVYLLMRGPYRFTRNPMYVAELLLWLGWALYFGSVGVLFGAAVLWLLMSSVAVPREERALEARFGDAYLEYKNTVPRWLGKTLARG